MPIKSTSTTDNGLGTISEAARELLAATADVAGVKAGEARGRLVSALESVKDIAATVRDKAVDKAKAADNTVRENPYASIAIALAVGAIGGFLIAHRSSRKGE